MDVQNEYRLCQFSSLQNGIPQGVELTVEDSRIGTIVLRAGDEFRVFLNSCPHTGVRLEWRENDFLDVDEKYLQCAMHGALFNRDDGVCVAGPCSGDRLVALEATMHDDWIYLTNVPSIPSSAKLGG